MISYVIGVLPLIQELWDAHPSVTQLWYTDNAGAGGSFGNILVHLKDLQVRGPPRGYFTEPSKTILVVAPRNMDRAKEFFRGFRITVVNGSRYLGRFIGDRDADTMCLDERAQGWAELLMTSLGMVCYHL